VASIGYITLMLADPTVRIVALTACLTLMSVLLAWGIWDVYTRIRDFVYGVRNLRADVQRFNKFLHEDNARRLAKRLYGNRDSSIPPVPVTHAPFFLRPSSPPPIPTIDATDWDDDDDRPSAATVVKSS
jgi:hypothetical protein